MHTYACKAALAYCRSLSRQRALSLSGIQRYWASHALQCHVLRRELGSKILDWSHRSWAARQVQGPLSQGLHCPGRP